MYRAAMFFESYVIDFRCTTPPARYKFAEQQLVCAGGVIEDEGHARRMKTRNTHAGNHFLTELMEILLRRAQGTTGSSKQKTHSPKATRFWITTTKTGTTAEQLQPHCQD